MFLKKINNFVQKFTIASVVTILGTASLATADPRLTVGDLPQTIIKTEECLGTNYDLFGWDGEQSCRISNVRLYGEPLPLTETVADYTNGSQVWSASDVANKTIRCDTYKRASFSYRDSDLSYSRDRFDITFLTEDSIPANAPQENLSNVTAHTYTRGWQIKKFGILETGLQINFNDRNFATEKGYLIIHETEQDNSSNELIANRFSHCFLRDEDTPFRATGNCVDYDGDGIGWNGSESCSVRAPDPNCDYTESFSNAGWGYNTATGESCPPSPNTTTYVPEDKCTNLRQEGWGWNPARQESCRVDQ